MSVKGIFKTLIGTIVIILMTSIVVELFNLSTTGLQINRISNLAGKQACVLFTQETYKKSNDGLSGAVNMKNITDATGGDYISGKFYEGNTTEDIFNSIYNSDSFRQFVAEPEIQRGNWYNLKLIDKAINHPESLNIAFGHDGYNEAMLAKLYKTTYMTPSNLGIPYLDKNILNRMFKWNLTEILSNCNSDLIQTDEDNNKYVSFRGFRVYTNRANITEIEYKTFDLSNASERVAFNNITNINPDKLGFADDNNLSVTLKLNGDERKRICLVGVKYSVPMTYEGITPMRKIFDYVWSTEVEGVKGNNTSGTKDKWDSGLVDLESGGLDGNKEAEGVLPVPGKLIYYIIR